MKTVNYELVKQFLENENPELYDMKKQWIDIENPLERMLYFKRKCCVVPDPDECDLTMSIMCILLNYKGFDVVGYEGRHIILKDGNKIETDTANSFISLYKGALMTKLPNYDQLLDKYDITGSFGNEYEKIYSHRNEFTLERCDTELFEAFCEFAQLTHSIGNFVLGLAGFNSADRKSKAKLYTARNWSTFDRMDLFLKKVADGETYDEWFKWYSENLKSTYTDFFFKSLVYTSDKNVDLKKSEIIDLGDDDLKIRVKKINNLIKKRGTEMVNDLRKCVNEG